MFGEKPIAYAKIKGSGKYPRIAGRLYLFPANGGSIVWVEMEGVTDENGRPCQDFRGFHIHAGASCAGTPEDPFANTGTHYNPANLEHPNHAGDLPPLLFTNGYAWMQVYTGRFAPEEVIGRTVVIHAMPDDFHTQPSGDSGEKIACGEIVRA